MIVRHPTPFGLRTRGCAWAIVLLFASEAAASEDVAETTNADPSAPIDEVTVLARRIDLSVSGGLVPENTFDEGAIRALATSSLDELLDELSPELTSGRGGSDGRPAYLVNGRRISNFREVRSYPPEAVDRIEIFPEEVAVRHGFRPDRKVVNIVLKEHFRSLELEGEAHAPRSGAGETFEASIERLRIAGARRFNLELGIVSEQAIHESERELVVATRGRPFSVEGNVSALDGGELDPALSALAGETVTAASLPETDPGTPLTLEALLPTANAPLVTDVRPARTLRPEARRVDLAASIRQPFGETLALTVTGTLQHLRRTSELGLPGYTLDVSPDNSFSPFASSVLLDRLDASAGPLERRDETLDAALDVTVNGALGRWQWSWLTELQRTQRETDTDVGLDATDVDPLEDPFAELGLDRIVDVREATNGYVSSQLVANSSFGALPGGPVSVSTALRYELTDLSTRTEGAGVSREDGIDRGRMEFRGSLDAPLLDSDGFGRVGANLNGELIELSDFGALSSIGAGLTWRPNQAVRLIASYAIEESAPGIGQLGDPVISTPNQRVFDFASGESATIDRLSGGNPDLRATRRTTSRIALRLEPFERFDLALNADLSLSELDDPVIGFPAPSEEIEAAFPSRFLREADGTLARLDARPINVEEAREAELRWGLRYTRRMGNESRSREGSRRSSGDRARGDEGRRGGGGPGRGGRGDQGGRLAVSLRHVWLLEDELRLAPGLEPIDYVGRSVGGRARGGAAHRVSLRTSFSYRSMGARMRLDWQSGTNSLPTADGIVALRTSDLATLDVRLFRTFLPRDAVTQKLPWLRGARLTLGADNLFGEKLRVEDANGAVPAGSSADELDPLGRVVYVELRRLIR